ncbi:hypothetical protein Tco_0649967 [Tanacetum coccineum]
MSDSEHSAVTYTSASEDDLYMGSPGVEVPVFEGPPSPDYVPGPEEPEQAPPSPIYIPFVPELVYPEFLPVDDEVFPAEEQPLPAADSPTHQSPGYIPESDPEEDLEEDDEEDPEEDPADYPIHKHKNKHIFSIFIIMDQSEVVKRNSLVIVLADLEVWPTEKHLHAVKRIFRYLRGTVNQRLWYPKDSSIALTAFADEDHAGCQDTRCSTSGSMQFLGDRLVSWSSKRQKSAAISSTKAKYIAMSKHIDIRFYFIKEHVENGVIELYFVNTEYQLADIFTKPLARERIEFLINKLGMQSFTPEILKQLAYEVKE